VDLQKEVESDGLIDKYKARLIIRGFDQNRGLTILTPTPL